ncbi:MAG: helix-turn-helix transcriptional regulator [Alphaproteobacteria bacterium]|nr:helix-turn-helix transcriptional regulator [Alphaproteobacteria bacterium]
MRGEISANAQVLDALASAIEAIGSDAHIDRLIDLVGALVRHDRVTVVRYSATQRPEFVSYRNYTAEMVRKYLEIYYVYDPFYAQWRQNRRPGVVTLVRSADMLRAPYVAEFLGESVISDELGVLLNDGPGWCLGIFLDRSHGKFSRSEKVRLEARFSVFAALHAMDIKARQPGFMRTSQPARLGEEPATRAAIRIPSGLWPDLSCRERDVVHLILSGHPTASIAARLGIAPGTVKNHRRRIYEKLDITTERELFLQFIGDTV